MLIVGMPHDVAHLIFAQVIGEARFGLREWPRPGDQLDGLVPGVHSMRVVRVDPQAIGGRSLVPSRQTAPGRAILGLQLVWSEFRVQA